MPESKKSSGAELQDDIRELYGGKEEPNEQSTQEPEQDKGDKDDEKEK